MPTVACSLAELYGELEFTYAASLTRLWDATKMDTEIRQSFGHDGPPEEELRHSQAPHCMLLPPALATANSSTHRLWPKLRWAAMCSPQEELVGLLRAMRPYLNQDSGTLTARSKSALEALGQGFSRRFCRFAAGLACISHKKKATFWRDLIDRFPRLIDFLCNTENVGQVPFGRSPVAWQCVQAKGRVLCACP